MTWDAYNRRKSTLREVIAVADRTRSGELPWSCVTSASTTFDDPFDLLLELQMYWHQRLSGHIEHMFGLEERDPQSAVVAAWREATAELPGVRAILDAHDDDPALAKARDKEMACLASSAGLAPLDHPRAVSLGELVREEARAIVIDRQRPAGATSSWLERLRGALVA